MAIYFNYDEDMKVKTVVRGNILKDEIDVIFENDTTGKIFKGWIHDFCADGGAVEIKLAIEKANESSRPKGVTVDLMKEMETAA